MTTTPAPYYDAPVTALKWDGTNPLEFAKWLSSPPKMDVDGSLKVLVGPKRGRLIGLNEWLVGRPDGEWDIVTDAEFQRRFQPAPADAQLVDPALAVVDA